MSTCSQEIIIANIDSTEYPQEVKQELVSFVKNVLISKGGAPSPVIQHLNECSPEFYNTYGICIYLILASGTACIFRSEIRSYFKYLVKFIQVKEGVVTEIVEDAKRKGVIDIMFWMHGFSAVMDRLTGFIANFAAAKNKDKYMPKFVRTILNMFCMLYNRRITLVEAKRQTQESMNEELYEVQGFEHPSQMSSDDFYTSKSNTKKSKSKQSKSKQSKSKQSKSKQSKSKRRS
jgi:hypothetical protein